MYSLISRQQHIAPILPSPNRNLSKHDVLFKVGRYLEGVWWSVLYSGAA